MAERPRRLPDTDAPLLEQMGGMRGLVTSTIPVLAFVPVNMVWGLVPAVWASVGAAVAILVYALVRRQNLQPAFSALIGVAICAVVAWRTGNAKGYFLYGIITQGVYGTVFAVSALVGFPLVGVIWGLLDGSGLGWRRVRVARRWYALATWAWAALFGVRCVLQYVLYRDDQVTWLGTARIAMGWPLALVGAAVTMWAVSRAMAAEREAGLVRGGRKKATENEPGNEPEHEQPVDEQPVDEPGGQPRA